MHRTTDPACFRHRQPRGRLSRWWYDRQRGRCCGPCMLLRQAERERQRLNISWLESKIDVIGEAVWDEIKRHPIPEPTPAERFGLINGHKHWRSGAQPRDVGRAVVRSLGRDLQGFNERGPL